MLTDFAVACLQLAASKFNHAKTHDNILVR